MVLTALSELYAAQGLHKERLDALQRVWELKEAVVGMDSIDMCTIYSDLARASYDAADDTGCIDNAQRMITIVKATPSIVLVDAGMDPPPADDDNADTKRGNDDGLPRRDVPPPISDRVDVPQSVAVAECYVIMAQAQQRLSLIHI